MHTLFDNVRVKNLVRFNSGILFIIWLNASTFLDRKILKHEHILKMHTLFDNVRDKNLGRFNSGILFTIVVKQYNFFWAVEYKNTNTF